MAIAATPGPPAIVRSIMSAPKPQGSEGQLVDTALAALVNHTSARPSCALERQAIALPVRVIVEFGPPTDIPTNFRAGMLDAMTATELAEALGRISQPENVEETSVPFNPDDYPLF